MNSILLFLAILLPFGGHLELSSQLFKNSELSITELESNMWLVETVKNEAMYIIEGKKKAMLIDTGTKCSSLDSIVKLVTTKPLTVVLTHLHPDHGTTTFDWTMS